MASSQESADGSRVLEVKDPDDYNQTRRLRQIHTARERVEEALLEGLEEYALGERDEENYQEYVAETLLLYLSQVEPLLTSPEVLGEDGAKARREARFWREVEIENGDGGTETLVETVETDNGDLTLEDILETDASPEGEVLSVDESRRAYRLTNRFVNEVGFGLSFDEGLPEDEL